MGFQYSYMTNNVLEVLAALISGFPVAVFNVGMYVLGALALYSLAQRRGIRHGWLAWVPVANCWLLGSLSDQYRYLVRGEYRAKRKGLLILSGILAALVIALASLGIAAGITMFMGRPGSTGGLMAALVILGSVTFVVSIVRIVVRFIALADLYRSMDPDNGTAFLVLSILFPVTEPFFLFFNRNKDLGMPPRREQPIAEEPVWQEQPEPWVQDESNL